MNISKMMLLCLSFTVTMTSCVKEDLLFDNDSENFPLTQVELSELEMEIIEHVNQYRLSIGKNPLKPESYSTMESSVHNDYMIENNNISHDNFTSRANNLLSMGAKKVGENVAKGYTSGEEVVKAWLKSNSHKNNIEGNYTHIGVSAKSNDSGYIYYTQIFTKN